jgi:gliding motility-associated-like protein
LARLYDANGFYDTIMNAYINVIACPPPAADFTATATELCPGDCIGFIDNTTNMNGAGSTWVWEFEGSDSASSQVQNPQNICYQEAGLYTVRLTATNPNGTDVEEKLEYIQVDSCLPPRSAFDVERDSLCRNMCVQFYNRSLRADTIEWVFQGADPGYDTSILVNPMVCYSDTGQFFVQLTTKNIYGVDIALELGYISIAEYPEVREGENFEQSYTTQIGEPVQIRAFGSGTSYLWTPDVAIDNPKSRNPTVNPTENTRYYVTTTNDHGCSATDSLRVLVKQEYFVGVPDIFSPNGDGENDVLRIRGNGIDKVEFFVYNRYGEKVFESSNVNIGWDGSFNGEDATPGVFMYFAKVTFLNGFEEIIKGDVTLIR